MKQRIEILEIPFDKVKVYEMGVLPDGWHIEVDGDKQLVRVMRPIVQEARK